MALSPDDLSALKSRCHKAVATGFNLGHANVYAAELSAELGQKFSGNATASTLLDIIAQVEAARAGRPIAPVAAPKVAPKAAPPPEEPVKVVAPPEEPVKAAPPEEPAKPKAKKKR
jgi:hypothetical protein